MKARRTMLMLAGLAGVAGCTRQEAPKPAGGTSGAGETETYRYLQEVGAVRSQVNADNRDRIPKLLSTQDVAGLGEEGSKIEGYRQALAKLDVNQVDPGALTFEENFGHILEAYKSACADAAELFREARKVDGQHPDSQPLFPMSDGAIDLNRSDTIGAVDSLLAIADRSPKASAGGGSREPALVERVRGDLDALRKAKSVHHEFTETLKVDLAERFPGKDWTEREILPPK
jgi:hypothetical protein